MRLEGILGFPGRERRLLCPLPASVYVSVTVLGLRLDLLSSGVKTLAIAAPALEEPRSSYTVCVHAPLCPHILRVATDPP